MVWRVVTPPTDTAITLFRAKQFLRVDDSLEDDLIESLIQAATDYVQVACNRALCQQTWEFTCSQYPSAGLPIPGNVIAVDSVEGLVGGAYVPLDHVVHLAEPSVIEVTERATLDCSRSAFKYVVQVGYEKIPAAITDAMLMMIGGWFNNRQSTIVGTSAGVVPMSVDYLLFPYRDGRTM